MILPQRTGTFILSEAGTLMICDGKIDIKNSLGIHNIMLLLLDFSRKCFHLIDLFYWLLSFLLCLQLLQEFNSWDCIKLNCQIGRN